MCSLVDALSHCKLGQKLLAEHGDVVFRLRHRGVVQHFAQRFSASMPSAVAKCCAGLLRLLRARRPAADAGVPLVGPSPPPAPPAPAAPQEPEAAESAAQAPAQSAPKDVEILAPPVRPLTKAQEEYEMAMKAASEEMQERVKHYKALNKGGFLTKHQEMDVRDLAAYSTFVTRVWIC